MKSLITVVFVFVLNSFCLAQPLDFSKVDFSSSVILNETSLKFNFTEIINPLEFQFQQNPSEFNMLDSDNKFKLNTENLNTKLFSNLNLLETNYPIDFNYSRGCGPLEDGLTHTLNSSDFIVSKFIDYVVNNYVFKGKGVFFKN